MTTTLHPPRTVLIGGRAVAVQEYGDGAPLLIINGTSQSLGAWSELATFWASRYRVITYDLRGMGGSERGTEPLSIASLAQDAYDLIEALELDCPQVLGYSLGSAVAQELALAHPERVAALVLHCTWGRTNGFQRAMLSALGAPWKSGDLVTALGALGLAFSPELLDSPDFGALVEQMLPLFPQTAVQIATTAEQWDADLAHDALDRLSAITAPTLVIAGEQDLLTPPSQGRAVADLIPGARFELLTGPGSSHALALERMAEYLPLVLGFLDEHAKV